VTAVDRSRRYGRGALVNASDIALYVFRAFHVTLKPATIRQWAVRKRIGTYGFRRERYDLREVVAFATKQGLIPNKGEHDGRDPDGSTSG
jgi:hypothetical protein